MRIYNKKRKERAKAEGLCLNCLREPADPQKTCCRECLEKKRLNTRFGSSTPFISLSGDLFEKQEGRCAICRERMLRPVLDHSHKTMEVRGLLCNGCNTGLGFFKDDPIFLIRASRYVQNGLKIYFKQRGDKEYFISQDPEDEAVAKTA